MAEYSNLTSLENLQVGDVVIYTGKDQLETLWNIETKGYKIKVELDGFGGGSYSKSGRTVATIDTTTIQNLTLYSYGYSNGLAVGTFDSYANLLYYRILVAGAQGDCESYVSGTEQNIKGGGLSGSTAEVNTYYSPSTKVNASKVYPQSSSSNDYYVYGGTQTSGAYFGYSGDKNATKKYNPKVGHGWYGGGYVETHTYSDYYGYGGGSGFIIGQTTTTYPAGYLGDDTELQTKIAAAISDAETIAGGSTYNPPSWDSMKTSQKITIIEPPKTSIPKLTAFYYKDGNAIQTIAKRYVNGKWENIDLNYYNGTEWIS